MQQHKVKGDEYMKKGDKKAKGSFFGNIMKTKGERADDALDQYKNALAQYKLAQNWDLAAEALKRMVDCDLAAQGGEAGDFYLEIANFYKKSNNADYLEYLNKAVEVYCNDNRIDQAARLKKQVGEYYEQELQYELAIEAYEHAAQLFYAENNCQHEYFNMRLKVADLSIHKQNHNFIECIKIYEEVAKKYCSNSLQAGSAKNLFVKCIMLFLAIEDYVGAQNALDKYQDMLPQLQNTRQQKFCQQLIECCDQGNADEFSQACFDYNKIIPLDSWLTAILTEVKAKIKPDAQFDNQFNNNNQQQDILQNQGAETIEPTKGDGPDLF